MVRHNKMSWGVRRANPSCINTWKVGGDGRQCRAHLLQLPMSAAFNLHASGRDRTEVKSSAERKQETQSARKTSQNRASGLNGGDTGADEAIGALSPETFSAGERTIDTISV